MAGFCALYEMSVNIQSSSNIAMPHELLNPFEIDSLLDQDRGVKVSQIVGRIFGTLDDLSVLLDLFYQPSLVAYCAKTEFPPVADRLPVTA